MSEAEQELTPICEVATTVGADTFTLEKIAEALRPHLQPIRIYDVVTDTFRPATQADVDRMQKQLTLLGQACRAVITAVDQAKSYAVGE